MSNAIVDCYSSKDFTEAELIEIWKAAYIAAGKNSAEADRFVIKNTGPYGKMAGQIKIVRDVIDGCALAMWSWIGLRPAAKAAAFAKATQIATLARKSLARAPAQAPTQAPAPGLSTRSNAARLDAWRFPRGLEKQFHALFCFVLPHPKLEKWMGAARIAALREIAKRVKTEPGADKHPLTVEHEGFTYYGGVAASLIGVLSSVPPGSTYAALSEDEQREYNHLHRELLDALHAGFYSEKRLREQQAEAAKRQPEQQGSFVVGGGA